MTENITPTNTAWKVLTVDGRSSVHQATKLLLEKLSFAGRGLMSLASSSLQEAKAILQKEDDIAIVLMDVEINGESIGLDLVRFIRKELQNEKTRIVLRTGYPNSLPKKEITKNYAIDGCLSEEEFSETQFEFTIFGAIQTYHQIVAVTKYLQGLAGSIAHEMRNPLHQVKQRFYIVKKELSYNREKLPKDDFEVMDNMLDTGDYVCEHANMMIDMILQNIKDQKINTNAFKTLSIAQTVHTAIQEFAFAEEGGREIIKLNLKQDFEFRGDDTLFLFVLFNLLKNSLYFLSIKPDLQIDICLEKGETTNTLFFKDNGIGVPKDKLLTIFDSFVTSGKKEGTGLGLSFCKRVMTAFDGDITCQSVVDQWTEFTLTFPKYVK